jgi:transposase
VGTARLVVKGGEITRFPTKAHFASWSGNAPIDASSGEQVRHRQCRGGNRQINRVLHIMACVQVRNPSIGATTTTATRQTSKSPMEAMRCVTRRPSDIVYQQMRHDSMQHPATGREATGKRL